MLKLSANTEGNGFQAQMAGMGFYIQNPLKSPNDYAAFTKPATRSFPSRSIMMDKRSGWKVRVLIRREWVEFSKTRFGKMMHICEPLKLLLNRFT